MTGGRKQKAEKGFTLIEILVSVAVFVVVVSMGAVLFITTSNAQRKAVNQEKLVRDVRQATETITRLSRMYPVDYTAYEEKYGVPLPEEGVDVLFLRVSGETISFSLDADQVIYNGSQGTQAMTSGEVTIDRLYFYVSPIDPDDSDNPQRVTLILEASRAGDQGTYDAMSVQTSVTARWYGGGGSLVAP